MRFLVETLFLEESASSMDFLFSFSRYSLSSAADKNFYSGFSFPSREESAEVDDDITNVMGVNECEGRAVEK